MAVLLVMACAAAEQPFYSITSEGTVYDLFVITRLNYGEDHKVTSVTGHFERIVPDAENGISPETAPDSETAFALAEDFQSLMCEGPNIMEDLVTPTDLYQWFVDTYVGGEEGLEGRELVFRCDLPEEEQLNGTFDFDFLTTMIRLNDRNEIVYMEYVWVPWA